MEVMCQLEVKLSDIGHIGPWCSCDSTTLAMALGYRVHGSFSIERSSKSLDSFYFDLLWEHVTAGARRDSCMSHPTTSIGDDSSALSWQGCGKFVFQGEDEANHSTVVARRWSSETCRWTLTKSNTFGDNQNAIGIWLSASQSIFVVYFIDFWPKLVPCLVLALPTIPPWVLLVFSLVIIILSNTIISQILPELTYLKCRTLCDNWLDSKSPARV